MSQTELACDVAIVGGGLAGSALAHALAQTPLSVVLVEARDPRRLEQPGFDARATALANGSQRILDALGLWDDVRDAVTPITHIHVSEKGQFGAARIVASEEGVPALGYLLENRDLGAALWRALDRAERFTAVAPASCEAIDHDDDTVQIRISTSAGPRAIRARLVVAADGASSPLRRLLGIGAVADDYAQHAVIVNCRTAVPHAGRAFERFTVAGPIAMLPLSQQRVAAVWTLPEARARQVIELGDTAFVDALQEAFGYRLGRLLEVGRRTAYPLQRLRSTTVLARRTVLIGSAAVNLHPVAGQGFNLALRDIAVLAEVLADAVDTDGAAADPGAADGLTRYEQWRRGDQARVAAFTHGLIRFFGYSSAPLAASRGLGLMLFDLLPGAKAGLARETMGLSGRLPRLALGLPLLSRHPPGGRQDQRA